MASSLWPALTSLRCVRVVGEPTASLHGPGVMLVAYSCCGLLMGGTQWKFSLYFMGTVPEGITLPEDRTSKEAIDLLWNWPGVLLELTQYVWHG